MSILREFCEICILLSAIRYIITLKNVTITDYVCYVTGFCASSKDGSKVRVEDKLYEYRDVPRVFGVVQPDVNNKGNNKSSINLLNTIRTANVS
jgi:hypothetical protein